MCNARSEYVPNLFLFRNTFIQVSRERSISFYVVFPDCFFCPPKNTLFSPQTRILLSIYPGIVACSEFTNYTTSVIIPPTTALFHLHSPKHQNPPKNLANPTDSFIHPYGSSARYNRTGGAIERTGTASRWQSLSRALLAGAEQRAQASYSIAHDNDAGEARETERENRQTPRETERRFLGALPALLVRVLKDERSACGVWREEWVREGGWLVIIGLRNCRRGKAVTVREAWDFRCE